ncbi:hypothetical protein [Clostridium massiliodielmoense]|uniref:hypothetical protein n=1 Tax=Clostridium massiliodielmoense TaxID=1776385 RepID=UPI000A26B276|nr:hypothetical protein [Clostridium massiliodielmoense]
MNTENFKKTEGILYRHYKNIRKKSRLEYKKFNLEKKIEEIRKDIKEANVSIDSDIRAIDYSTDKVQTSTSGGIELEIINALDKLEIELKKTIKAKLKIQFKIRELKDDIDDIDYILSRLSTDYKNLVELKYGNAEHISNISIGIRLNMTESTVRRKRQEVVECIGKWLSLK